MRALLRANFYKLIVLKKDDNQDDYLASNWNNIKSLSIKGLAF